MKEGKKKNKTRKKTDRGCRPGGGVGKGLELPVEAAAHSHCLEQTRMVRARSLAEVRRSQRRETSANKNLPYQTTTGETVGAV